MRKASVFETKNRLRKLLERVRRGETILITNRGQRGRGAPGGARQQSVRYWDSSTLVPLRVDESSSPRMHEIYRADPSIVTSLERLTK